VGGNAPVEWLWGGTGGEQDDFMLLLHAATPAALSSAQAAVERDLAQCGARCTFSLATAELPGRKEHFGFRGGIAQPHLDSDQPRHRRPGAFKPGPRHNTIAPGEVLLGYSNEFGPRSEPRRERRLARSRRQRQLLGRAAARARRAGVLAGARRAQ
jgi:hypothetical protein